MNAKGSDQTVQMLKLIRACCIGIKIVFFFFFFFHVFDHKISAPDKIKCDQVQIGSLQLGFQSFAHTQCGLYCQCSFNGVVINECPQGQAWDQAGNACTTAAKANC